MKNTLVLLLLIPLTYILTVSFQQMMTKSDCLESIEIFSEKGGRVDWNFTTNKILMDQENDGRWDTYICNPDKSELINFISDMTGQTYGDQAIIKDNLIVFLSQIPLTKAPIFIEIPDETQPQSQKTPQKRFGVEGTRIEIFDKIQELGISMREAQGVHFTKWGIIQPNAPINGTPNYRTPPKGDWSLTYLKQVRDSGIDFSVSIELDKAEWALEKDETIRVISPANGKKMPGLIRIKPEHEQDYKNFIKHYISQMPSNLRYIQVDSEPENIWVNGEGYYRAIELTSKAVKEYEQETGQKITIMAAGFYLGLNAIRLPEDVKEHMYTEYPNVDHDFIKTRIIEEQTNKGMTIDESLLTPQRIQYLSQKIHVTMTALNQKKPAFDIVTIHLDHGKTYDHASEVINWYKTQMKNNGYDRPIWIDDMSNNYFPTGETEEDMLLGKGLESSNQQIINEHAKRQPSWLLRKIVGHFAAGAEKVKLAYDMEIDYYMIEWRYAGLFDLTNKKPKPAYYSARIIINKLDNFTTATKISLNEEDYLYKFTFENKPDVFVAWTEPTNNSWSYDTIKTIDLSNEIGSKKAKITPLVNQVNNKNQPITRENKIMPSNQIPLSSEPTFIEAQNY